MTSNSPIWRYALLFITIVSVSLAASPTSFCKCTCFTNSTIIPLDDTATSAHQALFSRADTDLPSNGSVPVHSGTRTCADCNKSFCLSYNLAICKDAEDTDVFATCFQRDSTKDQIVIYLFLLATVGLLAWAAIKPHWEKWRDRRGYSAVNGGQ